MTPARAATADAVPADRLARLAERWLRRLGDARLGLVLLLATGAVSVVAALVPGGGRLLDGPPYAALLGAVALSGVATIAARAPSAWREWRQPGPVAGSGALRAALPTMPAQAVLDALGGAGYRTRLEQRGARWRVHAVRRGWARFAGVLSHAALVVVVLGASVGAAYGSEMTFSLLPGEQALLDAPRPGFSAAVRLDTLDAEFGSDGRPQRLDTAVAFLRDGRVVRTQVLQVNRPGDFEGYLVHAWTYGPAAQIRVTTLGGTPLLDDAVPLDGERDGVPVGSAELPTAGVTLGLALVDAEANTLGVSVLGASGLADTARLRPGDAVRVGDVVVELEGFAAWVTFLSRRDPGLVLLFVGAALLVGALAVAFWFPRRRATVRTSGIGLELLVRGERLDRPADELARLERALRR